MKQGSPLPSVEGSTLEDNACPGQPVRVADVGVVWLNECFKSSPK